MAIVETFQKRMKRLAEQGQVEVLQCENLPYGFRVQVIHIWATAIGPWFDVPEWEPRQPPPSNRIWGYVHSTLARETGLLALGVGVFNNPSQRCRDHLMSGTTGEALDIIELSFRVIDHVVSRWGQDARRECGITQSADDAIEELNGRFREHAIGYQYVGGKVVRVDSLYLHAEAVRPALTLLHRRGYEGPCEEFLEAHEHHRKGNGKDAIQSALKSFESTMKAICARRKWPYPESATAKVLLDVLFANGVVPPQLQSEFTSLRTVLESGLPTVRNKTPSVGHGQGSMPVPVPDHLVAFALHLAAANIVFLVEADAALG